MKVKMKGLMKETRKDMKREYNLALKKVYYLVGLMVDPNEERLDMM